MRICTSQNFCQHEKISLLCKAMQVQVRLQCWRGSMILPLWKGVGIQGEMGWLAAPFPLACGIHCPHLWQRHILQLVHWTHCHHCTGLCSSRCPPVHWICCWWPKRTCRDWAWDLNQHPELLVYVSWGKTTIGFVLHCLNISKDRRGRLTPMDQNIQWNLEGKVHLC